MLTIEILKNSEEFKSWINGKVALIHDIYQGSEGLPSFIVLHSDMGKWTITRFWRSPNRKDQLEKIHVSVDYQNISTTEVFELLLTKYSRGLA